MKKLAVISIAMLGLLLNSCNQPANVQSLLENPQTRNEIYSTILEDHQMMTDFMDQMTASEHGMMMMQGHEGMRNRMMEGAQMMDMMKQNPKMMNQLMKNGPMMGQMLQRMQQNGMMSEECLQSTMKMMEGQGMKMEGMGMQGSSR